jgi:nucleotide-binding universal stress UspA family protein
MVNSTSVTPESLKGVADQAGSVSRPIVVGYDGSDLAKSALRVAIEVATCSAYGRIAIVCGQDRPSGWFGYTYRGPVVGKDELLDELETRIASDLEEAAAIVRRAGIDAVTACTREHPVDTLLTVAQDIGAAMIVVGAKGTSAIQDVVMGSTTMRLLHRARIPVLVVPEAG